MSSTFRGMIYNTLQRFANCQNVIRATRSMQTKNKTYKQKQPTAIHRGLFIVTCRISLYKAVI